MDGRFSVLVTLGVIPIICCPKAGASHPHTHITRSFLPPPFRMLLSTSLWTASSFRVSVTLKVVPIMRYPKGGTAATCRCPTGPPAPFIVAQSMVPCFDTCTDPPPYLLSPPPTPPPSLTPLLPLPYQAVVNQIVDGLFSVLVTLGVVPIIRCPKGGAAEHVAAALEGRLRDHLKARSNLFSEGSTALSATLSRPLLVLFDRNFDLSVMLQHCWSYKPLVQVCGEGGGVSSRNRGMLCVCRGGGSRWMWWKEQGCARCDGVGLSWGAGEVIAATAALLVVPSHWCRCVCVCVWGGGCPAELEVYCVFVSRVEVDVVETEWCASCHAWGCGGGWGLWLGGGGQCHV